MFVYAILCVYENFAGAAQVLNCVAFIPALCVVVHSWPWPRLALVVEVKFVVTAHSSGYTTIEEILSMDGYSLSDFQTFQGLCKSIWINIF